VASKASRIIQELEISVGVERDLVPAGEREPLVALDGRDALVALDGVHILWDLAHEARDDGEVGAVTVARQRERSVEPGAHATDG
jgi:hypothetical protein